MILAIMAQANKKFRLITLGCRTNQYETQAYQDQLTALGYEAAGADEAADICIVNTCTVTESADSSSRHEIRKLARENPNARIVVTGCSVERQPDAIRQIEGVTDLISNADKEQLIAQLFPDLDNLPEFQIKHFEAHTRAFVKVQDGCNSFCTYCIIPYVRGRSRSRTMDEVLDEIRELVANGYKEIVLTGINIGDFDGANKENPSTLADLVRAVDAIPGIERVRLSSIDPDEVDDALMDAIINGKNTCHSLHIVLQSGSNIVLKRMNRKYTRQMFMESIEKLRQADPDFTFTTDIIVGFPGETEVDHAETLAIMDEVCFAKVHMFPYSDRPRTRSALYKDKVPPSVIKRRKQEVMRRAEKVSHSLRQQYIGRTLTVLTENTDPSRPNEITGHTENFLQVWIQDGGHLVPNQLVTVELLANSPQGLIGRLVDEQVQQRYG